MLKKLTESSAVQIPATLVTYLFYGLILGTSMFPSAWLIFSVFKMYKNQIFDGTGSEMGTGLFAVCLATGLAVFIFFISGLILMGLIIRILSIGIKPGSYNIATPTVFRWLIFSGIYTMSITLILPVIPMTFFSLLFFKIIGAKIGRNTQINSYMLNDAYLLEIGDNVIVGGQTDISCHIFENNKLILKPVKIGDNSLIGAHCYISPGVTIGKNCIIGLNSYIRKDKTIPDNTRLTTVAAVNFSTAGKLEKE